MTSWFSRNSALLTLTVCVLLQGCSAAQPKAREGSAAITVRGQIDGSIRYDTDDPRLAELWSAAEEARLGNNDARALDLLYQALDISPNNSLLWSRAAEVQLENDQALSAENLALKSNLHAGDNPVLLHRNWLIIEHARSLRGDLLGVRSARKQVQAFQDR